MKKVYDYKNYGSFKATYATPLSSFVRSIAAFLRLKHRYIRFLKGLGKHDFILEIGCGDGSFLKALKDYGFTNIIGIDPSLSYSSVDHDLNIYQADAFSFLHDQKPRSFDAILMLDVIEHISLEDLKVLIPLIRESLTDCGLLIMRTPNMSSPLGLRNYFGDLSHVTPLNEISIMQLFFQSGFHDFCFFSEPFQYPRSLAGAMGILMWPIIEFLIKCICTSFGINSRVLTPNLVCILRKK